MKNFIKGEFYKVLKSNTFKILFFISCVVTVWDSLELDHMLFNTLGIPDEEYVVVYGCDAILNNDYYLCLLLCFPLFTNLIYTSEFSSKSIRNVINNKADRIKCFISKLVVLELIILFFSLLFYSLSIIIKTIVFGFGNVNVLTCIIENILLILKIAFYVITTNFYIVLISMIVKKESIIIIMFFLANLSKPFISLLMVLPNIEILNFLYNFTSNSYENGFLSFSNPSWQGILMTILYFTITYIFVYIFSQKKDL